MLKVLFYKRVATTQPSCSMVSDHDVHSIDALVSSVISDEDSQVCENWAEQSKAFEMMSA